MATYYVRTDGNDGNAGTGSTSGQAWKTIQKALGATGIGSGDTLYIAPGVYREAVTIGGTYSATTYITGDPTASQFSGVAAGEVRLTGFSSDTSSTSLGVNITATSKNNLYWSNIFFQNQIRVIVATTCNNWTFEKCYVQSMRAGGNSVSAGLSSVTITGTAGTSMGLTCTKCIFDSAACFFIDNPRHSSTYNAGIVWENCFFHTPNNVTYPYAIYTSPSAGTTFPTGGSITNCVFSHGGTGFATVTFEFGWNSTTPFAVKNCLYLGAGRFLTCATAGAMVETYNRYPNATLQGVTASGTSSSAGIYGIDLGYSTLVGLPTTYAYGSTLGSVNAGFGVSSGAPATDMFGVTWTGATPDAGAVTYRNLSTLTGYLPTERNASTITIAPGSTSQSIELYLGATGLTASTSGLSARYNRTRTASVSIPLVARTIAQAWTAGGFAEVDATNMPGVYRLDVPDAALAAGADDVTVVVRGASGTNGAVMTVKLSSGGLTSAQTASAVWGADVAGYVAETNFGGVVNATRNVSGNTEIIAQDIPSNVWEEVRANHTTAGTFGQYVNTNINTGAIADAVWDEARSGHTTAGTFGQYVNAELVTPVTQSASVRPGPFLLRAGNGIAGDPLDIQKGSIASIDIQCVDANSTGVDITGATVTTKVYNTAGTLVATYTNTSSYSAGGRTLCPLDATVTGTAGTYTANVWVVNGSNTTIYGPLRLYVRDI